MAQAGKDWWDKSKIIARILIPVTILLVGWFLNSGLKTREIQATYVDMALDVLQRPDPTGSYDSISRWAYSVISEYAPEIPLELDAWLAERRVPTITETRLRRIFTPQAPRELRATERDSHSITVEISEGVGTFYSHSWLYRVRGGTAWIGAGSHTPPGTSSRRFSYLTRDTEFEFTVTAVNPVSGLQSDLAPVLVAKTRP